MDVECDGDGNFEVIRCREDTTSSHFRCQCVDPVTGEMEPESQDQLVLSPTEASCLGKNCIQHGQVQKWAKNTLPTLYLVCFLFNSSYL